MTALENQIATTDVVASLDIEMVKNFNGEINRLTEVLGLFAPSIVAAGTTMYTYKVTGELETDAVAEGDEIPCPTTRSIRPRSARSASRSTAS